MDIPRIVKKKLYFDTHQWIGIEIGKEYRKYKNLDRAGNSSLLIDQRLIALLNHCKTKVPYYADVITRQGETYLQDPRAYLKGFPILTKEIIRSEFDRLKSADLERRKWRYNTSGGSTGEPVLFIQDNEFYAKTGALQWLSHRWAGRRFGEPGLRIWGSDVDVIKGTMGFKAKLINYLTNDTWFNAFQMTPDKMRLCLKEINRNSPKLISAYAHVIYDLARFAEDEGIEVQPQSAILTSAGTLYPFMREKIESVFQCKVFNRYGSREVGDVACECEVHQGLHVFPWGNYIEVVDDDGLPVAPGEEGNILVTNLTNYAMPLIRYFIGDRGVLSASRACSCGREGQILELISGRNVDSFKKKDGTLVSGMFFAHLLFYRDWVSKFQVIQKDHSSLLFRIVRKKGQVPDLDLQDIVKKARIAMGEDCKVSFEFVDEIPDLASGKYRYTISEVENSLNNASTG
jgi:phenylacetate-CoA ligase